MTSNPSNGFSTLLADHLSLLTRVDVFPYMACIGQLGAIRAGDL